MTIQIIFEDDHFLAAVKPVGISTHAVDAAHPGFVEALEEQTGLKLGVHQRLDAGTSGVIVFSKSAQGAQRLGKAFELRNVKKTYRALVCGIPQEKEGEWSHKLLHKNGKTEENPDGKFAKSRYRVVRTVGPFALLELDLMTGLTHQLRVQCALAGFPILGDALYGGGDLSPRLMLHAARLRLMSEPNLPTFHAPLPRELDRPNLEMILSLVLERACRRESFNDEEAIRLLVPQHSGLPEVIVEKLGPNLLVRHLEPLERTLWDEGSMRRLFEVGMRVACCSDCCYRVHEAPGKKHVCASLLRSFSGTPEPFEAVEKGVRYSFDLSGNASGLYLDQRDNRAWVREYAHGRVLNLFAYTCAFSVCAAFNKAVTDTTSVDAAPAALRRGRANFELNGLTCEGHRFMNEDALKYLAKCAQNGTQFDTVICDPPSFGRFGKVVFSLEDDLEKLLTACLQVAAPKATVLFSINHRKIRLSRLKNALKSAAKACRMSMPEAEIFVNDDALGPLGVGTDLKTIRFHLK